MKPAEHAHQDELGKLGAMFCARLQSERLHLASLSAALAGAEESPAAIFKDLHFRAHRLKGTAAIFEFKDIAAAAHNLEHAARFASDTRADNTDADVWAALIRLVGILGAFEADQG